jgi:orotidine 5'-phosphate decarboxylase subfamily 2
VLCLGIDPHPDALPRGVPSTLAGVEAFAQMLLRVAAPCAAAVKANAAFFEAFGSAGVAALERLRAAVPADVPFILDAKRGDIPSTAEQYAAAAYDALDADAVTASPYLGPDSLEPLLARADRFVYVLCRTSNPGSRVLQELIVAADDTAGPTGAPAEPLAHRIARSASGWQRYPGTLGLVVGATASEELGLIRAIAPDLPFLVPGLGSQGGDRHATMEAGPVRTGPIAQAAGGGLLVNVSRGIAGAAVDAADPESAIAAAAADWSARLRCYDHASRGVARP